MRWGKTSEFKLTPTVGRRGSERDEKAQIRQLLDVCIAEDEKLAQVVLGPGFAKIVYNKETGKGGGEAREITSRVFDPQRSFHLVLSRKCVWNQITTA